VRILVVDDNEPSALTLTWAMEMYGYDVRTCYDGKAALLVADAFDPDVVLMDLGMPIMNGVEACRRLRENPAHSHTLVIAQTGWGDADTRQLTSACFNHHVVKPINLDHLLSLLPPAQQN
jgi:CheY-like chemotaxis protein